MGDYQPSVVFEGVARVKAISVPRMRSWGEFEFDLNPPRIRELAVLLLTFHLDANDILHINARLTNTPARCGT